MMDYIDFIEEAMDDAFLEHSFSRMVDRVSDYAIFLLDLAGVIKTWNPAAEVMKGYLKNEAVGRDFSMLYTVEDRQRNHPQHNLEHAAKHGTFQESAWRQRKDGSLFWALVEVIAIRNDAGELEGFCKLTRDLTNLKQLQEHLKVEKERAEVKLGAIADGVISVDGAGLVEYVNHQAERFVDGRRQRPRDDASNRYSTSFSRTTTVPRSSGWPTPRSAACKHAASTCCAHVTVRGTLSRFADRRFPV